MGDDRLSNASEDGAADDTVDAAALRFRRNDEAHRYEAVFGSEVAGYAEFVLRPPARIVFTHTVTEPAFTGHGIATRLRRVGTQRCPGPRASHRSAVPVHHQLPGDAPPVRRRPRGALPHQQERRPGSAHACGRDSGGEVRRAAPHRPVSGWQVDQFEVAERCHLRHHRVA